MPTSTERKKYEARNRQEQTSVIGIWSSEEKEESEASSMIVVVCVASSILKMHNTGSFVTYLRNGHPYAFSDVLQFGATKGFAAFDPRAPKERRTACPSS